MHVLLKSDLCWNDSRKPLSVELMVTSLWGEVLHTWAVQLTVAKCMLVPATHNMCLH